MAVLQELMAAAATRARALGRIQGVRCERPSLTAALAGKERISVLAEFKRRSPSEGAIAEGADLAAQLQSYENARVAGVSVLTEPSRFGGRAEDLERAVQVSDLPLLMKDFVVDEAQVAHASVLGASAVLLIARCLEPARLRDLAAATRELGMCALVECHDGAEVETALSLEGVILGINNRDLDRLDIDRARAEAMLPLVPADRVAVAESGYDHPDQVRRLKGMADAVLIGTALMRGGDPAGFVQAVAG